MLHNETIRSRDRYGGRSGGRRKAVRRTKARQRQNGSNAAEAIQFDRSRRRLQRFYRAVRFAFPQRFAITNILALTLTVAALNAVEPLLLKLVFDELAAAQRTQVLILGLAAL